MINFLTLIMRLLKVFDWRTIMKMTFPKGYFKYQLTQWINYSYYIIFMDLSNLPKKKKRKKLLIFIKKILFKKIKTKTKNI